MSETICFLLCSIAFLSENQTEGFCLHTDLS